MCVLVEAIAGSGLGPETMLLADGMLANNALKLMPLGGRAGDGVVDAAASRSPFGERRRRSSSAVFDGQGP